MFFKGMELQGFKSFAEKTVLDFRGGITAVVGPNGSGKSNISDAIRWVMGETSAKSLRGSRMEDVIFCGSEKRKPVGFAEVTIIMDNTDRSMNIDFSEVSVTRRVYRSGESEYMINKAPCRLKDIHELFMDTGLGRDGYSIIGQGKIDAILSAKSEERRHIFDEAAGITKYRYRKNEAEKKLADTQNNLTRVGDIITELESQVEPLRKQSEKAMKFIDLREKQKDIEVNLWLKSIDDGKIQLAETAKAYETVHNHINELNRNIEAAEKEITVVKDKIRIKEGEIDKAKAEMYRSRDSITKTKGEIEVLRTTVTYNSQNSLRLEGEIAFGKKRKAELGVIAEETEKALSEAMERVTAKSREIELIEKQIEEINGEIKSCQADFDGKSDEITKINENISDISARLAENARQAAGGETAKAQLLEEKSQAEAKYLKRSEEIEGIKATVESLEKEVAEAETAAADLQKKSENAEKSYSRQRELIQAIDSENKTAINRKHILEELENDFEGYSKPVKAVMNEHKFGSLSKHSLYGPVSSLMKVEDKYVAAIEAALGGAGNNVVVETEEDAKGAIEFLKSGKKGRVTFMPVASVTGKRLETDGVDACKGYIGNAADIPKTDNKFSQILLNLLGRTVVVDNIDNGIAMARKHKYSFKIATLQGEIINAGGSISGGSSHAAAGGLSRRSEIKALEAAIAENEKKAAAAGETLAELKKENEQLKKDVVKAQQLMWESRRRLTEYTTSQEHVLRAYRELQEDVNRYSDEIERVEITLGQAKKIEKEFKGVLEELQNSLKEKTEGHSNATEKIELLREKYIEVSAKLGEMRILKSNAEKDAEICDSRSKDAREELKRITDEINEKKTTMTEGEERVTESKRLIEEKQLLNEKLAKEAEKNRISAETAEGEKEQMNIELDKKQEGLKELNSTIFKLQSEEGRLEARKAKIETEQENIISKLWEEYEMTYSTAEALRKENVVISEYQKILTEIKMQIRGLGTINLNAIEDYKTTKERYEFLKEQQTDILKAKQELETLIGEMMTVMAEMFEKNFAKLSEKFSETFRELFGGGRATLKLSDPEDILESGVEIEVQPPGKNLQNINLLSGGEKAFTAIAIIFAILKINPTHFCIFDEIEAALDDVNVFRFADFLKALSKKTQFIVITHRKGTMEAADTLYGVTMQEKGVTSLLSLELDKIAE